MAKKYHIKDDGTPGECTAASAESCPKTQAGDSFHGTLAEATTESERRFEADHGATATASRSESLEDQLIAERDELQALYGQEENALRTAANKARSATASKRATKSYEAFNERTGYRDKIRAIKEKMEGLGYESLGELVASRTFAQRALGNGGMALPPKISGDQAVAYSFKGKGGWLVATSSGSNGESQYFLHQNGGQWVASRIDLQADPLEESSRVEIRPDNLKTFFSEQGTAISKPRRPLGGKYPIDPSEG